MFLETFFFTLAFVRIYLLIFVASIGILISCKKKEPDLTNPQPSQPELFVGNFNLDSLEFRTDFDTAENKGVVNFLPEASGIIGSHYNSNHMWSHNDGGHAAELFLFDASDASLKATFSLNSSSNLDWEDIAVYFSNGFSYIYIGDVGDNIGLRPNYSLYAFEEPRFDHSQASPSVDCRKIDFVYPDGPNNCETIMVDPLRGDLIFATKSGSKSEIFVAKASLLNSAVGQITLRKIGELALKNVTGGDISLDGKMIVLRTYNDLVCWERNPNESLSDAFSKTPKKLPYNGLEPQGESFCWVEGGYYTLSEKIGGQDPSLYFYAKK